VDPPCNEPSQAHEGMGACRGRIRVVQGAGMADQSESRSCLARSLRRGYDRTMPGTGVRYSVRSREMGGGVTKSWTRGMAELAKAVIPLWQYLGFLTLTAVDRGSRLKNRSGYEVICPRATRGAR